jgi:hypothetical protein
MLGLPEQSWPSVERQLQALKSAGSENETNDKAKLLEKRVEDLEAKIRKLEEKWDDREAKEKETK